LSISRVKVANNSRIITGFRRSANWPRDGKTAYRIERCALTLSQLDGASGAGMADEKSAWLRSPA
jgi:hypothetical protein